MIPRFKITLKKFLSVPLLTLFIVLSGTAKERVFDVCVYGETPAGITAALQVAKMGRSVVLISTNSHVGGMATSGLTATDLNNFRIAGGFTKEFYQRVYAHYLDSSAWRVEGRTEYFERSKKRTYTGKNDSLKMQWVYEAGVGEKIFKQMLQDHGVEVIYNQRINLKTTPFKQDGRLKTISMESGLKIGAKMFIDASYEGDLMRMAGVSFKVGRESNATYGETMNGIRMGAVVGNGKTSIDPYVIPGNPNSGLLPFIDAKPAGPNGTGDDRTQTYCYRLTLTNDPANKIDVTKPSNYNPLWYEFLARVIALNPDISLSSIISFTPMPNKKTDTNQGNFVGNSYAWPNANHATRLQIAAQHKAYSMGLLWFLGNDERLPLAMRTEMKTWGWPKDEYLDTDHFPYQVYVREARRMTSDYVMTEQNCNGSRPVADPVAIATYPLDCHFIARVVDAEGKVRIEGGYGKQKSTYYGISYRSIIPQRKECSNLLVPVCLSASHVAYSSIRMEPVYMVLGQTAGTAAVMALDRKMDVQDLGYDQLKTQLLKDGQVLSLDRKITADIVIYGGTSSAITAAVQAAKMGKSVVVVSPDLHLGGLSSNGLGYTDTGDKTVIGGLARNFYHRLYNHYQTDSAWKWQQRSAFGNKGQGTVANDTAYKTMWLFEPHVAEAAFENMIRENNIMVYRDRWLDRSPGGVTMKNNKIISFKTLDGTAFIGKAFIDATYEGDLMAAAGVGYTVGRESAQQYGEQWNGVQTEVFHHAHHFKQKIDPYNISGKPSSGLLPEVSAAPPGNKGDGDNKIQAYCYRLCMSANPENSIPFPKPEGYDPKRYEILSRLFAAGWRDVFPKFDAVPNKKTDTNNHGPFSSDFIGGNHDYPDASYVRRKEIILEHERYQKGYLYFMANDPSVPKDIQQQFNTYGLAKDEFIENGGWPYQLYVREARRMLGDFVMTEKDALAKTVIARPIGMGSYSLDSHNTQRYVTAEGYIQNEGDIGVKPDRPYSIDFGAILPKEKQCSNLLVSVCVSSSHIAYGSIRMEPVFMILGQSAALAAALAIDKKINVQQVPYDLLEQEMIKAGQILRK